MIAAKEETFGFFNLIADAGNIFSFLKNQRLLAN